MFLAVDPDYEVETTTSAMLNLLPAAYAPGPVWWRRTVYTYFKWKLLVKNTLILLDDIYSLFVQIKHIHALFEVYILFRL